MSGKNKQQPYLSNLSLEPFCFKKIFLAVSGASSVGIIVLEAVQVPNSDPVPSVVINLARVLSQVLRYKGLKG